MTEWLQFSLLDMTSYDRLSWFNLIEGYYQIYTVLPFIAATLTLLLLWLILGKTRHAPHYALILLAVCWGWCGWVFQMQYHASLNWAGIAFGWVFVIQAGLLLLAALLGKTLTWRTPGSWQFIVGLSVVILGTVLYPATGLLESRTLKQLEWFAAMPAPTTLATLGVLMLLIQPIRLGLLIIPLLWSLISAAFAWTLGLLEVYFTGLALLALVIHWLPVHDHQQNRD